MQHVALLEKKHLMYLFSIFCKKQGLFKSVRCWVYRSTRTVSEAVLQPTAYNLMGPHHRRLNSRKRKSSAMKLRERARRAQRKGGGIPLGGTRTASWTQILELFHPPCLGLALFCLECPSSSPTIFLLWVIFHLLQDSVLIPSEALPDQHLALCVLRNPVQISIQVHDAGMMLPSPSSCYKIRYCRRLFFCCVMFSHIPLPPTLSK